jgi:hypothetical protein
LKILRRTTGMYIFSTTNVEIEAKDWDKTLQKDQNETI